MYFDAKVEIDGVVQVIGGHTCGLTVESLLSKDPAIRAAKCWRIISVNDSPEWAD